MGDQIEESEAKRSARERAATDPNLVFCESWDELVQNIASGGYDLSAKEVCRQLRVSRREFGACVRPWLRHVRVANSIKDGEGREVGPRWHSVLRHVSGVAIPDRCTDLYNRDDYEALLADRVVAEARVKAVPIEDWVDRSTPEGAEWLRLREHLRDLHERIAEAEGDGREVPWRLATAAAETSCEMRQAALKALDAEGRALWAARVPVTRRADAQWAPADEDPMELLGRGIECLSELRDWGDADETVYRDLHARGALRLTVTLPRSDGQPSTLVRWADDPDPVRLAEPEEPYALQDVPVDVTAWRSMGRPRRDR